MYLAKINVTLKPSVLDPQGVAVSGALQHMGYKEVKSLRIGKSMELQAGGQGPDPGRRQEARGHHVRQAAGQHPDRAL